MSRQSFLSHGNAESIFASYGNAIKNIKNTLKTIKRLAFKDSVSANYTPTGMVSQPTATITGGETGTVNSITNVGELPTFTIEGETLVFHPGTLPTKGANQTVVTATGAVSVSRLTFTGAQTTITSK